MKKFFGLALVLSVAMLASTGAQAGTVIALDDVTDPGFALLPIVGTVGVHSTVAGGDTSVSIPGFPWDAPPGQYPGGESPANAIDNNVGGESKYLNFGAATIPPDGSTQGTDTGMILNFRFPARITGLRFRYANDAPDRDPDTYTLEGGGLPPINFFPDVIADPNDPGFPGDSQLQSDASNWTLVSSGSTGLVDPADSFILVAGNRDTWQDDAPTSRPGPSFANPNYYKSYRLLFPTLRNTLTGNNSDMQINEIEFIGELMIPEPTSAVLALAGLAGCMVRRRK